MNSASLALAALEHQEMNGKVEVTRRTLRTIEHSLMVHTRVLEEYIHFFINVYDRSYLSGSTNQISDKRGW